MVVTCPSCKTKYRLEDKLIRAPYQKMRCSRCGHIFVYQKPGAVGPSFEEEAIDITREAETEGEKKSRKGIWIALIVILVLAAVGVGLYFYWQNYLGAADKWLSIRKTEGQELVILDGSVFLINGMISNGSTKARKYITLRAKLFDGEGKVLGEKDALAGLSLSKDEVQQMRTADIEKKVNEFPLLTVDAFAIDRHKEVPFSIIFLDSDSGKAKEFTVEITECPLL